MLRTVWAPDLPFYVEKCLLRRVQLFKHLSEVLICHTADEYEVCLLQPGKRAESRGRNCRRNRCGSIFAGNSTALSSLNRAVARRPEEADVD